VAGEGHAGDHEVITAEDFADSLDDVGVETAMEAPTVTTDATPMMMPISVKNARSLWAKIDCRAIFSASE